MATMPKVKKPKPKKAPKKKVGAKLTLTQKVIDDACDMARKCNFQQDICRRLKLNPNTFNCWLKRGREERREYYAGRLKTPTLKMKLVIELDAANAEGKCQLIEDVANSQDDRVKLKFLTMRYGKSFAQPDTFIDDDTGEEKKRSASDLLAEKLASFLK